MFRYNEPFAAGRIFRIRVEVENPMYISQRDMRVFSVSNTNGRLLEKGKLLQKFAVDKIQLYAGNKKFMWGINNNEGIPQTPYRLFKLKSGGKLTPYNSIYIAFKVGKKLVAGFELVVRITLEA